MARQKLNIVPLPKRTHKVSVAQPHEAISEVHRLVLQDVHTDLLLLRLSTCDQITFIWTHRKAEDGFKSEIVRIKKKIVLIFKQNGDNGSKKMDKALTHVVLTSDVSHYSVALRYLHLAVLQVWKLR